MARVVRAAPPRVDLGFASLEAEVARLLPAAEAVEAAGPEAPLATGVLVAAALLAGGDEDGARDAATRAAGTLGSPAPAGSRLESVEVRPCPARARAGAAHRPRGAGPTRRDRATATRSHAGTRSSSTASRRRRRRIADGGATTRAPRGAAGLRRGLARAKASPRRRRGPPVSSSPRWR
jgi:hypothetical protein